MVRDHYVKLGLTSEGVDETGSSRAVLELDCFVPTETFITVTES
jgi:hypothetical protein